MELVKYGCSQLVEVMAVVAVAPLGAGAGGLGRCRWKWLGIASFGRRSSLGVHLGRVFVFEAIWNAKRDRMIF